MPNRKNFLSDKGKSVFHLGAQEVCKAKGKIDMCVSFSQSISSYFRSHSLLLCALKFSAAKLPAKGYQYWIEKKANKRLSEQYPS